MHQSLEDREVTISRLRFTATYLRSFMLVARMNSSPARYFKDPDAPVTSSPEMKCYLGKISGPLLDRIDVHIDVIQVPFKKRSEDLKGEASAEIRNK